jgi:enamine deaminase RidA (YjgF/YER057c/UK114 family)
MIADSSDQTLSTPLALSAPARTSPTEFTLTQSPHVGESVAEPFRRLADELAAKKAELLSLFIFGALTARNEIDCAMREALGEIRWPITWVDGAGCDVSPLAGLQAFAISGCEVVRVRVSGRVVASVYEDGGARHCLLGGLGPTSLALGRSAQMQQMLGNFEWALQAAGFEWPDVVRTWFYNDDIVRWYGDFNRVRTAHYADVRWRSGAVPASTGIGARNPSGAAVVLAAWAIRPLDSSTRVHAVPSPRQCPAPEYGSSFSRAMEIDSGGRRRLLISGTASIEPGGATAWVGNVERQIALTMEVVEAILESRGMSFRDVTRATAYVEHPLFKRAFRAWCRAHGWEHMPVIVTCADICRADLLFELELDACTSAPPPRSAQASPSVA